jgi:hypothetical protein
MRQMVADQHSLALEGICNRSFVPEANRMIAVRSSYPNSSMIGLPVVKEREMPLASVGSLMGMSRAW